MIALYVGVACGVATLTVSKGKIFLPLRERLSGWLGEMVSCPYCFSHWVCALAQAVIQWRPIAGVSWVSLVVGWLVLVWIANVSGQMIVGMYTWAHGQDE